MYRQNNYLNKDIYFFISKELFEYDIQSAGFNILKKYKIVNNDIISELELMDKYKRQIYIGNLMKHDRNIGIKLNEGYTESRKLFFIANNLVDSDILSIKKDAIFTFKHCPITEFDNIIFIQKNIYTSYYYLNKKEFYYNSFTFNLDIKGISDDTLKLHENYMIDYFRRLFKIMEISTAKNIIKHIKEFSMYYKERKLEVGYYREFNSKSKYLLNRKYMSDSKNVYIEDIGNADRKMIDISYNYINYVVPMVTIII